MNKCYKKKSIWQQYIFLIFLALNIFFFINTIIFDWFATIGGDLSSYFTVQINFPKVDIIDANDVIKKYNQEMQFILVTKSFYIVNSLNYHNIIIDVKNTLNQQGIQNNDFHKQNLIYNILPDTSTFFIKTDQDNDLIATYFIPRTNPINLTYTCEKYQYTLRDFLDANEHLIEKAFIFYKSQNNTGFLPSISDYLFSIISDYWSNRPRKR